MPASPFLSKTQIYFNESMGYQVGLRTGHKKDIDDIF